MAECTWKGCRARARHEQINSEGQAWADLCTEHHDELEEAVDVGLSDGGQTGARLVLRAWARAGHGHPMRKAELDALSKGGAALLGAMQRLRGKS